MNPRDEPRHQPPHGLADVVDVDAQAPTGREIDELANQALDAGASFEGFAGVRRLHFGMGAPGVFGVFLAQLRSTRGPDEWRWLVVGDLPRVAFPAELASTPRGALAVYCDSLDAWLRAKAAPTAAPPGWAVLSRPTRKLLKPLASRLAMLRELVLDAPEPLQDLLEEAPLLAPEVERPRFRPGDLVLDQQGRAGLVAGPRARPDADWLARQRDGRSRWFAGARWWSVLPLTGGSMAVAEPLMVPQGSATDEQLRQAWREANDFGKRDLENLFPGRLPPGYLSSEASQPQPS